MAQGITIFMRLVGSQRVVSETQRVRREVDGVNVAAGRLRAAGAAGFAALATGAGMAVSAGVKYTAQIETMNVAFGTLLGSQKKAQEYSKFLEQKGAATPFQVAELARASQTLLGFNYSLGETQHLMDTLGNASSALGRGADGLQSLALIFGQIRAKGRLQGDELLQLAENGISGGEIIRKRLGMSKEDFRKALEGGKIDSETAITALTQYMDRKYAGSMDKQSRTLAGQYSTFKDNLNMALKDTTGGLTDWLRKTGLPEANAALKEFPRRLREVQRQIKPFTDALGDAGEDAAPFIDNVVEPFAEGFGKSALSALAGLGAAVAVALRGIGAGLKFAGVNAEKYKLQDVFKTLGRVAGVVVAPISGVVWAFKELKKVWDGLGGKTQDRILSALSFVKDRFMDVLSPAKALYDLGVKMGLWGRITSGERPYPLTVDGQQQRAADEADETRTTPRPAPSMVPGKNTPKRRPRPKSSKPFDILKPVDPFAPKGDTHVSVQVDGREIAKADARTRADEAARR